MDNMFIGSLNDIVINSESLDIRPITCGYQKCPPRHRSPLTVRNYFLIHYCVSGKGTFHSPMGTFDITPGKLFIICPGERCEYRADEKEPWEYIWLGLVGSYADKLRSLKRVIKYHGEVFFDIRKLAASEKKSPAKYTSLMYELFYELFDSNDTETDRVADTRTYIKFNYMYNITVESVSQKFCIDRYFLAREFRKRYNTTVRDYIIDTRIAAACRLLADGYQVSESANMVGYDDVFNFSKVFKKRVGMSPSEYKRKKPDLNEAFD